MKRIFAGFVTAGVVIAALTALLHGVIPNVPTGQWLPGPSLGHPRTGAVSVALHDGRVLVIGGRTAAGPVATVEVYRTDGALAGGPSMRSPRAGHAAALLLDGSVLVTGGTTFVETSEGVKEAPTGSLEVFDPRANAWYELPSALGTARTGHTATVVADGRVVVAGGTGESGALDTFEIYDPETGTFGVMGLLSAARVEHAATAAGEDKVVVVGGRNGQGVLGTADVVDLTRGTTVGVQLSAPRAGASVTTLLHGLVLVAGGWDGTSELASSELLNPATATSTPAPGRLNAARRGHQALLLPHNATVLIAGGTQGGAVVPTSEQYIPWDFRFVPTPAAPNAARAGATTTALWKPGVALLAAGHSGSALVAGTELYGFATVGTDKDDYSPGQVVYVSASGWVPNEEVTFGLRELPAEHESRTFTIIADENGRISNAKLFDVEEHHLGVRFYLTARGQASQAQVTFTDGNISSATVAIRNATGGASSNATTSCASGMPETFSLNAVYCGQATVTGISGGGNTELFTRWERPSGTIACSATHSGVVADGVYALNCSLNVAGTWTFKACSNQNCSGSNVLDSATATVASAAPTTLHVVDASGTYGSTTALSATLKSGGNGVNGQTISFKLNGNGVGTAVTNSDGIATLSNANLAGIDADAYPSGVAASFAGDASFLASSGTGSLTVAQKAINGNLTASDKVYDGTTAAAIASRSLAGVVGGDDVSLIGGTASFDTKDVGTGKTVSASGFALTGAKASNYTLASTTLTTTANITARSLTVTATGVNKTYDGKTTATVNLADDRVAGDVLATAYTGAAFADKNVGSNKAVTVSGISITGGADAGNYTLASTTASTTASIARRTLVVSATGVNKVYDGTTAATVTLSDDRVTDDDLTTDYADASFDTKEVGTGKPVSVSGMAIGGADAGNYALASTTASTTANITAKEVTGSITAANKVYDGTRSATITARSVIGVIGSDVVSLTGGTAEFADKNVGAAKTVTGSGFGLTGGGAGNYTLASSTLTTTADITARSLTVTATGVNKVYDGTTAATVTLADDRVADDALTTAYTSATFADKHVGTGKAVSVEGISISAGADAGNYTLANTATSTTAEITVRTLIVTATGVNKVYDGTTTTTVTLSDNRVSDDALMLAYTGASFDTKSVGTGKTVSVTGISISGGDAANYTLAGTTATATADITAKEVTGSFIAADKVYDGTTSATIAGRSLAGTIGGDVVSLTGGTAAFDTKNVGSAKAVTATGFALAGADAGNYTLKSDTLATTADITLRPLTATATGLNKVYDGTTAATVTLSDDRVVGDSLTTTYTGATFADKNVGSGKPVNVTGIGISGADAANYSLTNTTTLTTADITQRALAVNATGVNKIFDGTTAATVTLAHNALLGDIVVASYAVANFDSASVGANKIVTVTGIAISGGDAGNYSHNPTTTTTASILAWTAQGSGFYQPVGVPGSVFVQTVNGTPILPGVNGATAWNTAKGGSTIPLKFHLYAGDTEKTSVSDITGFTAFTVGCAATVGGEDPVEFLTTGGTALRYDAIERQFVQNWKTPSVSKESCYRATATFADGSTLSAFFRLRK